MHVCDKNYFFHPLGGSPYVEETLEETGSRIRGPHRSHSDGTEDNKGTPLRAVVVCTLM